MRHLQTDLKCRDGIRRRHLDAPLVVRGNGIGIHRRPEFAVGEREIGNRQPRVLMPHRRTKDELEKNQNRRQQRQGRAPSVIGRSGSDLRDAGAVGAAAARIE